ncbi:unnamed protein product [Rotaria sp. Silwood1]|nr:unnamed protein product [Rotaria sp. Silwood1]CAF3765303.1 unnamed protein product [Rotaria sp. Silwood1]
MTNNDHRPEVFMRRMECGNMLAQTNEENCSMACVHNGKYRLYAKIAELAMMNVEYEIKRVAEHHMNLINEYLKQAEQLVSCDIINASRLWYNVRVQQAIFDLLARGHFLNVVQYNGYDGCGDSCIKGVVKGRQIYFPFSETTEKRKNHEFYLKSSKHNTHRSVQGIKGPTPLSSILQLPNQIPYDSMHLIYHEHVKTLLKFWQNMFGKEIFENDSVFLSNVVLPYSFKYKNSFFIGLF